jgi:hypothetical protein
MKITPQPILPAAVLKLYEERLSVEEIRGKVDKRPLGELELQIKDAFQQILTRAHTGDDKALGLFFILTRQAVMSFESLVTHELKRTRAVAEQSPNLPVLLSLNPQDIEAAKERARLLNVGARAILPTRTGQRTDRRNHWTKLAIFAFNACMENIQRIPQLELQLSNAKQRLVTRKLWDFIEHGTKYTLPNGKEIVIADWQKKCAKLAPPITADNFNHWKNAVKICVLIFWKDSAVEYAKALKIIGDSGTLESSRRHLAMNRTLQAFKSQFLPR